MKFTLKNFYVIQHNLKTFRNFAALLKRKKQTTGFIKFIFTMTNLLKKAANAFRTANYCIARAELYLNEAKSANEK